MLLLLVSLLAADASEERLLRRIVAETALAQVAAIDPAWHPEQRDCAGLVRFSYRAAHAALDPEKVVRGLWLDGKGTPAPFADAETLLSRSFVLIGRDRADVESGDLVAFRQGGEDDPVFHLMVVVRPEDKAHGRPVVVYHPGSKGASVRIGKLDELERDAPAEWRPVATNPAFLGFFRYREWIE